MKLGEMLIRAHLIDEIQLKVALKEQKISGEKLGSTLVALGFIDENVLSAFLSKQMDIPCVSVGNLNPPQGIISLIPQELAREYSIFPVRKSGDRLYLAMTDPTDYTVLDEVEKITKLKVDPLVAAESSIKRAQRRFYSLEQEKEQESEVQFNESSIFPGLAQEIEINSFIVESFARLEKDIIELRESIEILKRLFIKFVSKRI